MSHAAAADTLVMSDAVPSIKLDGQVFFESKDILAALEGAFPEPPLLPNDPDLRQQAQELIDAADDLGGSGYRFMRGKSMTAKDDEPAVPVEELRAEFEAQLAKMEESLGRTDGPFFLSEFSLVDITYIPSMQRLASQLGHFRGFHLRGSEAFPRVSAWLEALNHRESFNAVKTDDGTLLQIFLKVRLPGFDCFGIEPKMPVDEMPREMWIKELFLLLFVAINTTRGSCASPICPEATLGLKLYRVDLLANPRNMVLPVLIPEVFIMYRTCTDDSRIYQADGSLLMLGFWWPCCYVAFVCSCLAWRSRRSLRRPLLHWKPATSWRPTTMLC